MQDYMNLISPGLTSSVDWQLLTILIWTRMLFLLSYHRHLSTVNEAEHVSISVHVNCTQHLHSVLKDASATDSNIKCLLSLVLLSQVMASFRCQS